MDICTQYGQKIFCLLDNARCKLSGRSPYDMDRCPTCNFDTFGDMCVPELCDKYEEREPAP